MTTPQSWNDYRVETLVRLWRDGLSAAQVARRLGGVSRNAVLGKLHRLGLSGTRPSRATARVVGRKRQARRKSPAAAPRAGLFEAREPGLICDVCDLGPHACRWPIGDPKAADFSFCGRLREAAGSYCAAHRRIARRRRRHRRSPA